MNHQIGSHYRLNARRAANHRKRIYQQRLDEQLQAVRDANPGADVSYQNGLICVRQRSDEEKHTVN